MAKDFYSIMLSLSGICQSIVLINQLSETGDCHNKSFEICINSILNLYPTTVLSVYGSQEKNLELGIKTLISLLNVKTIFQYQNFKNVICYILNLITLENKLKKNIKYNNILLNELSLLIKKNSDKNFTCDILTNLLSKIYVNTVSNLDFRIQILGSKKMLHKLSVQNKIRCVLLSGIRSVVLWRQIGGTCFQFIFYKHRIYNYAKIALDKLT